MTDLAKLSAGDEAAAVAWATKVRKARGSSYTPASRNAAAFILSRTGHLVERDGVAGVVEALGQAVRSLEWWQRNEPGSFRNIDLSRLEEARAALGQQP